MKNSQENTLYENHIEIVKTIKYIYTFIYIYIQNSSLANI